MPRIVAEIYTYIYIYAEYIKKIYIIINDVSVYTTRVIRIYWRCNSKERIKVGTVGTRERYFEDAK